MAVGGDMHREANHEVDEELPGGLLQYLSEFGEG